MSRASGQFIAGAAAALLLASCAHREQVAVAPPPAPAPPPRPVLHAAYQGVAVPPVDAEGHYRTINAGIGEQQALWHVRAALNVAALSCRGPENAGIVAAYNTLLKSRKAVLARANKAVEAEYRKQGSGWADAHDRYMTQLYNYFAMPQASVPFCRTAATLAPRVAATEAAALPGLAPTALMELEAPMIAVYQAIDATRTQMADWDARYGPDAPAATQVALAAPAPAAIVVAEAGEEKPKKHGKARLGYERIDLVMAWEPREGTAMALR